MVDVYIGNYSVVLGSWKCMECSHSSTYNFIWLTVVMALAGLTLVVLLMLVKMTVSSGTHSYTKAALIDLDKLQLQLD